MKGKILFFLLWMLFVSNEAVCFDADVPGVKISLGFTGGVSQDSLFLGDVYLRVPFPVSSEKIVTNIGYSFFKDKTDYIGTDDLEFGSHGLFGEVNYYLMKNLYMGFKLSYTLNAVNEGSRKDLKKYSNIDVPSFFSGTALYGHIGYYQSIGKYVGLKVQGQVGIHNYRLLIGDMLFSDSSSDTRSVRLRKKMRNDFLCNMSIGLVFRF